MGVWCQSTNGTKARDEMVHTWWILWWIVLMLFLISPVGYGWGYRGWGAPYPRYIQRRRVLRASGIRPGAEVPFDHGAWGRGGDFVWAILAVEMFWLGWALWAH
jgi:hypothetical protein